MKWPPAHPEAERDFVHAVEYFREVSPALARRFVLAAMSTVVRIRERPASGSPIGNGARRMQIHPFSCDLVYMPDHAGDIYVVAFAHHRRKPGFWTDRL